MPYFYDLILYYIYLMRFPEAKRFEKTRSFVQKHLVSSSEILDLGTPNDLSKFIGAKPDNLPCLLIGIYSMISP